MLVVFYLASDGIENVKRQKAKGKRQKAFGGVEIYGCVFSLIL